MNLFAYILIVSIKFLTAVALILGTAFMGFTTIYFATIPDVQWLAWVCGILFIYLVFVTIWSSDHLEMPNYDSKSKTIKYTDDDIMDRLQKEFNER